VEGDLRARDRGLYGRAPSGKEPGSRKINAELRVTVNLDVEAQPESTMRELLRPA
jgi:hypothetical protein